MNIPKISATAAATFVFAASASAAAATPPNLILMLIDDYGYNKRVSVSRQPPPRPTTNSPRANSAPETPRSIGYHARLQPNADEIRTPNLDALAAAGVTLERHYVYRFCSPSRSYRRPNPPARQPPPATSH